MDTGTNDEWLGIVWPQYLQSSIDSFTEAELTNDTLLDCWFCDLQSSINIAEVDGEISHDQATYLRKKYLYGDEEFIL